MHKILYTCLLTGLLPVLTVLGNEIVCFEAEAGHDVEAPLRIVTPGAATRDTSGGSYVEIPEKAGNPPELKKGRIAYRFAVQEKGDYILWARVYWEGECSNSFTMSVDGAPPFSFGQDATYKAWHWIRAPRRLKQLSLAPGQHTLLVRNREDGVRLDQLLVTRDRRYVPMGVEDITYRPPVPADKP